MMMMCAARLTLIEYLPTHIPELGREGMTVPSLPQLDLVAYRYRPCNRHGRPSLPAEGSDHEIDW